MAAARWRCAPLVYPVVVPVQWGGASSLGFSTVQPLGVARSLQNLRRGACVLEECLYVSDAVEYTYVYNYCRLVKVRVSSDRTSQVFFISKSGILT